MAVASLILTNSPQDYVSPVPTLTGRARLSPGHPLTPRYVTRYQDGLIRNTFMFLNLPIELRLMIYEYCVDISGISKTIKRYYHEFKDASEPSKVLAPFVWMRTPRIFLLNRQIYAESITLLPKQSITFDHGLLDLAYLKDFVAAPVLRTLSSITVTDTGHDLFHGTKNPANSWYGYMEVIEQLGNVLAPPGHRLKTFTLSFASKEFEQHVTICWDAAFVCGYRDTFKKALAVLGRVRNIGCVNFRGLPEPAATHLKNIMQRPYLTFFCLPLDVRHQIYSKAANISDCSKSFNRVLATHRHKACIEFPACSTPTVLLLNRQITAESLPLVRTLAITPSSSGMAHVGEVPSILHFITTTTLQHLQQISIIIKSWACIDILSSLLPVLANRHSLKKFYLYFQDSYDVAAMASQYYYPDVLLHNYLAPLASIRGLESVVFARNGSLPSCYTIPLTQIMLSEPVIGEILPKLMVEQVGRSIIELDDDTCVPSY